VQKIQREKDAEVKHLKEQQSLSDKNHSKAIQELREWANSELQKLEGEKESQRAKYEATIAQHELTIKEQHRQVLELTSTTISLREVIA
jgi:hypothetical protein